MNGAMSVLRSVMLRAAFVVAGTAALAEAQRPGIGTFGRGRGPGKLAMESGIEVTRPINAVNLLVENRPSLALSDSQFTRILAVKRQLDSTNAPLYRRIDSLQRVFKPGPVFSEPSTQRRDSLAAGRAVARETVAALEDNIAEAREKAFGLLSASQLTKAEELEQKARKAGAASPRGRL